MEHALYIRSWRGYYGSNESAQVHLKKDRKNSPRVYDLHIAILMLPFQFLRRGEDVRMIIAQLEVSLYPCTGMFWSLAIVPVRKTENKTRSLEPFLLAGRDKLINDALSVVRKIAKLRFPHGQ